MSTLFDIEFSGAVKADVDREQLVDACARRFNLSRNQVDKIIDNGLPMTLKKGVDRQTAEQCQRELEALGMVVDIRQSSALGPGIGATPEFAQGLPQPVAVAAGRGVDWIAVGYREFVKPDLGAWIGAVVLYVIAYLVLSMVPLLGPLAAMLLAPVIVGGFMWGARAQSEGQPFTVNQIFKGFSESTGQLMMIGVLYLVGMIAIGLIAGVLMGSTYMALGAADNQETSFEMLSAMALPLLICALLVVPLLMAYWFAPPLVILNRLSAVEAMKLSFTGCAKNLLPLLVYGLVGAVLAVLAAIPFMLGFLLLAPVVTASMFVAYRDIFPPSARSVPE